MLKDELINLYNVAIARGRNFVLRAEVLGGAFDLKSAQTASLHGLLAG